MFDVIWTDPNVERMGQRMLRKEQEAKEKEKRRAESVRQSVSTSSSSASSERGFSLFSGKLKKKKSSTPSEGKTNPYTVSYEESECGSTPKTHRSSMYGAKSVAASHDAPEVTSKPSGGTPLPAQSPPELEARSSPISQGENHCSAFHSPDL